MNSNKKTRFTLSSISACLIFSASCYTQQVFAEENVIAITGKQAESQSSDPILSNAELSQCLKEMNIINQTAKSLRDESDQIDILKNELVGVQQNLDIQRKNLDWHSQESVNEYNRINNKLKTYAKNYTSAVDLYNQEVRLYKTTVNRLKKECGNKRYQQNKTAPLLSF